MAASGGRTRADTLSPSRYHRSLWEKLEPAMAYSGGAVRPWQAALRRTVRRLTGDRPATRCPLRPRRLWLRDHPLGTIEKVVFTAEPCADVPAYVCLPHGVRPPYPFMICLQGHSTGMHNSIGVQRDDETLPLAVEGDRDFAIGCLRRGIAALCIEQRSFGERRERAQVHVSSHGCHDAAMHALLPEIERLGRRFSS